MANMLLSSSPEGESIIITGALENKMATSSALFEKKMAAVRDVLSNKNVKVIWESILGYNDLHCNRNSSTYPRCKVSNWGNSSSAIFSAENTPSLVREGWIRTSCSLQRDTECAHYSTWFPVSCAVVVCRLSQSTVQSRSKSNPMSPM